MACGGLHSSCWEAGPPGGRASEWRGGLAPPFPVAPVSGGHGSQVERRFLGYLPGSALSKASLRDLFKERGYESNVWVFPTPPSPPPTPGGCPMVELGSDAVSLVTVSDSTD